MQLPYVACIATPVITGVGGGVCIRYRNLVTAQGNEAVGYARRGEHLELEVFSRTGKDSGRRSGIGESIFLGKSLERKRTRPALQVAVTGDSEVAHIRGFTEFELGIAVGVLVQAEE